MAKVDHIYGIPEAERGERISLVPTLETLEFRGKGWQRTVPLRAVTRVGIRDLTRPLIRELGEFALQSPFLLLAPPLLPLLASDSGRRKLVIEVEDHETPVVIRGGRDRVLRDLDAGIAMRLSRVRAAH